MFTLHLNTLNRAVLEANGAPATAPAAVAAEYMEPREMAEFDKDNAALDKVKELGIDGVLFEHSVAMTVEEQGKALCDVVGVKTKNLFLKVRWRFSFIKGKVSSLLVARVDLFLEVKSGVVSLRFNTFIYFPQGQVKKKKNDRLLRLIGFFFVNRRQKTLVI